MTNDTKQLIEDYSDSPQDKSALLWMQSSRCRLAWFTALAICPVQIFFLGIVFGYPPQRQVLLNPYPWHAQAVDILLLVHLGLSAVVMVASPWVWGRYWWLGWAFDFLILFLTALISVTTKMAMSDGV
ncbi:hypothetical protein [Zavarzinella formosa]|uniref:hypothetical protein n=1 Tax=Zavarzinella formosa TaxID=360055 RepID=UPI0002E6E3D4|nr:hypothetical protein [Zavarzinella formosa]